MAPAQPGILVEGSAFHYFLEFRLSAGAGSASLGAALREAGLPEAATTEAPPHLVAGFGPAAWTLLAPDADPGGLRGFEAVTGPGGRGAPATQNDIFVWVHGPRADDNFDRALTCQQALAGVAETALDQPGFTYQDSRDLTGFIDGTENPKGDAAPATALIADGPAAGGSYVLTQRWVHDLTAFNALSVADQERVIGRTKPDSIQLSRDQMPEDSHVSRMDAERDGAAVKILRRSAPFGTVSEHGLYFLAFAAELERFDFMLRRMFGATADGIADKLIFYSRPVTGSYYFAPSLDALDRSLKGG